MADGGIMNLEDVNVVVYMITKAYERGYQQAFEDSKLLDELTNEYIVCELGGGEEDKD